MLEFNGLDNVLNAIDDIANTDIIKENLQKACFLVEAEARKKAPKVSGELRNSIESKIEEQGGELVGVIYTPLHYAPYVEFGTGIYAEEMGRTDVPWFYYDEKNEFHITSGMKPMPYLRPALYENRDKINDILKRGLIND